MQRTLTRQLWYLMDTGLRRRFWGLFALMLVAAVLEAVGVGIIPVFIAALSDPARLARLPVIGVFAAQWTEVPRETILFVGGGMLAGFYVFRGAFLLGLSNLKSGFSGQLMASVGERLFAGYIAAPYIFHLTNNTSNLIRNVHIETQRLGQLVTRAVLVLLLNAVMIGSILAMMLMFEPILSLIVFLVGGGSVFLFLRSVRGAATRHGRRLTILNGTLLQGLQEGLGAFKDTRLRGLGGFMNARLSRLLRSRAHSWHMQQFLTESTRPIVETVGVLGLVLVPCFLVWRGTALTDVLPMLALLAAALIRLLPALNQLTQALVQMRSNASCINTLYEELQTLESQQQARQRAGGPKVPMPTLARGISVRNLSFAYPASTKSVVSGLSLEIPAGSSVGFVGSTGAGKTTAVDLILGLLDPMSGEILVDGVNIQQDLSGWQRQIGYIPQTIFLLDDTIRRNIAFGIPEAQIDEAAIWRAVETAQLDDFIRTQPEGLETVVGERGVRLSGGQRQRIGIARALYHDPSVLVMDEATAAVDNVTERRLMEALGRAKAGRTLIMIAHRLTTVVDCDTIFLLKDGALQDFGTFAELRRTSTDFDAMAG